jgi:hypothetical protein
MTSNQMNVQFELPVFIYYDLVTIFLTDDHAMPLIPYQLH